MLAPLLALCLIASPKASVARAEADFRAALAQPDLEAALRPVVRRWVDYDAFAERSLAGRWNDLSEAQQKRFTDLLRDVIEASYLDRAEPNASFHLRCGRETQRREQATVECVLSVSEQEVALRIEMVRRGRWRVYDVVLDGASLLRSYRAQFRRLLRRESWEALLVRLEQKLDQLRRRRADESEAGRGASAPR